MKFSLTKNLCQKLRKIRKEKEYSQEFVAETLGLSQKTYSNIENNKSPISIDLLQEVSKLYDVEITELLNIESISKEHESEINLNDKLIQQYEKRIEEKDYRLRQLEEENKILKTKFLQD